MWCGVISTCAIKEGDSVTVGCYADFEWAKTIVANGDAEFTSTLKFLESPKEPKKIEFTGGTAGEKATELMMTHYNIANVQPRSGITATCKFTFMFQNSESDHATNEVTHTCKVPSTVECEYRFDFVALRKHSRDKGVLSLGELSYLLGVDHNSNIIRRYFTAIIQGAKPYATVHFWLSESPSPPGCRQLVDQAANLSLESACRLL